MFRWMIRSVATLTSLTLGCAGAPDQQDRCMRRVSCPEGTELVGGECVRRRVVTKVENRVVCPPRSRRVGDHCESAEAVAQPTQAAPAASTKEITADLGTPQTRGPRLVNIPAGTFQMGSSDSADERPPHKVAVSAFFMDETEVTVGQYRECVAAGVCRSPTISTEGCNWGRADRVEHPMNCVDWTEADAFCREWAKKRLPTEEEWEYAARGQGGWTYPWGETSPDSTRLCWRQSDGTCRVAAHPKGDSPFGLHDMAGNVWEWTASHHCPYGSDDCASAARVFRGGGWFATNPSRVRAAIRYRGIPTGRGSDLGFRCAR